MLRALAISFAMLAVIPGSCAAQLTAAAAEVRNNDIHSKQPTPHSNSAAGSSSGEDSAAENELLEAANKSREAYTNAVVTNEPTNPLAQDQAHNEEFELNKIVAAHPLAGVQGYNPNGSGAGTGPDEGLVQGLLDYRLPLPGGNVLAREPWASAIREAAKRNPSWTPAEYANRQKVVQRFRSGPDADRARAANQAVGHLDQLSGAIEGLGNSEGVTNRPVDWLRQTFKSGSDPAINAFDTPRGFLSEEMGKFFHGSPSEQAARTGLTSFNRTSAPSVNRQAVGSSAHLLQTGLQELESQLKAGLGLPANAELPDQFKELIYHPDRMEMLQRMIAGAPSEGAAAPGSLPSGVSVRRVQ